MKCIWSIGNMINDGHKALAVLTLNNLLFDGSLLLLHDATSVFTTLCSNCWIVKRKWRPSFSYWHNRREFNTRIFALHHILCVLHVICFIMGSKLTSVVHNGMFHLTCLMETFSQAKKQQKASLASAFPDFARSWLAHREYPLSKSDEDSEWNCPRDQSDGRRHPTCGPSSPAPYYVCSPAILHMTLTWLMHFNTIIYLKLTYMKLLAVWTAEQKCCHQSSINEYLWRPLCYNLKTAQAYLVSADQGCGCTGRMMHHLVRLDDNLIPQLCKYCKILPVHFCSW